MRVSATTGPVECHGVSRTQGCGRVIQAAEPGHEGEPVSHGLGPCCWDAYRAAAGLPPRPYPGEPLRELLDVLETTRGNLVSLEAAHPGSPIYGPWLAAVEAALARCQTTDGGAR